MRSAGQGSVDRGPARARATDAVVGGLRRLAGRGPDRAKAVFLGEDTIAVEVQRVMTTTDRTLAKAGHMDAVDAYWRQLGTAIQSALAAEVGKALAVEARCTAWIVDARSDRLLLVFSVRRQPRCRDDRSVMGGALHGGSNDATRRSGP